MVRRLSLFLLLSLVALAGRAQHDRSAQCAALISRADSLCSGNALQEAQSAYHKALELSRGQNDSLCGLALAGLGSVYVRQKMFQNAMECITELEELSGRRTQLSGVSLEGLYVAVAEITTQTARSQKLLTNRSNALKQSWGVLDPGADRYELSGVLNRLAANYYLQAVALHRPAGDAVYAGYLMSVGECFANAGRADTATVFVDRALELSRRLHGERSSEYAAMLTRAGMACVQAGDYRQGKKLVNSGFNVFGRLKDAADRRDTLVYIELLDARSAIRFAVGQRAAGIRSMKSGNALRREFYGDSSEQYMQGMLDVSMLYSLLPSSSQAERFQNAAYDYLFSKVRSSFSVMSEDEREKYWGVNYEYFQQSIAQADAWHRFWKNLRARPRGRPATAYNSVLLSKGILLNSANELGNYIRDSGDTTLQKDYARLRVMRYQRDTLSAESPQERELIRKTDSLERDIIGRVGPDFTKQLSLTWRDVRDCLGPRDVAIEFYRTPQGKYGALVLRRNWRGPRLVRLRKQTRDVQQMPLVSPREAAYVAGKYHISTSAADQFTVAQVLDTTWRTESVLPIDSTVSTSKKAARAALKTLGTPSKPTNFTQKISISEADARSLLMQSWRLRQGVWSKLTRYMPPSGKGNVYFAPDGVLNLVGIEYLPADKLWRRRHKRIEHRSDSSTMSDRYDIYRLSSIRQLVADSRPSVIRQASLYGGIKYSASQDELLAAADARRAGQTSLVDVQYEGKLGFVPEALYAEQTDKQLKSQSRAVPVDKTLILPLPGTVTEVHGISELLAGSGIRTGLYTGAFASEDIFKANTGDNLIHLATHGFFLPLSDATAYGFFNNATKERPERLGNPLYRTGLQMAGANTDWVDWGTVEGTEDGILTSKEISALDLKHADLVVLSACQTAVGDLKQDGVFGLQRAFKMAGAHTLVMSLWKVDDQATMQMMIHFYENLRNMDEHSMDKHSAFINALKALRADPRYNSPFFWSAFIMLDADIPPSPNARSR